MKRLIVIALSAAVFLSGHCLSVPAAESQHLFLVRETISGAEVDRVRLPEGEAVILDGADIVTVVLPLGVGQSGDLVKKDQRGGSFVAMYKEGELRIKKIDNDGKEIHFPPVKAEDLQEFNIRVNISAGDGAKAVYLIRGYEAVDSDDGPVIDMFGGMIPMEMGDYSITLEISRAEGQNSIAGETEIYFKEGFLLTEGRLPNGRSGTFIVDFGAGSTVVIEDFLPAGTEIEELRGVEYSEEGRREIKGQMKGAGGTVEGFLGIAHLEQLIFGHLEFPDIKVRVIEEMPEFRDLEIAGILGIDLLRQASKVSFGYSASGPSSLEMQSRVSHRRSGSPSFEIPFSIAANHMFIDGAMNGTPVTFLFDTGARSSIVSTEMADRAGLKSDGSSGRQFEGLDGNPIDSESVTVDKLRLGDAEFDDIGLFSAHLPVLLGMGLQKDGAILGNDFLQQFERLEVDFSSNVILLWK